MDTTSKSISVLHLRTVNGTGGGPDKTILKSCEYLSQAGHRAEAFYILNRRHDTGVLQASAKKKGVTMHTVQEDGPVSFLTLWALNHILKTGRYDLIHTHDYKSNVLAELFRIKYRYKIVATAHGYNPTTRRELLYYRLERWMFKLASAVIAPTRNMHGMLRGLGLKTRRLHIIPNGIETQGRLRPAHQPGSGPTRLLYLGRLSEEKDIENLLSAVSILQKEGYSLSVTLAGDGPDRPKVEKTISDLKLGDWVRLTGFVSDVQPLLAAADIMVNPSKTECMPNSILEAMWAMVPVVATDVGGVGEMMRDGVDGLLCPPEDSASLAEAIKTYITNPPLAQKLSASANERVMTEFTFEKHMEKTLDLYRQVLAR